MRKHRTRQEYLDNLNRVAEVYASNSSVRLTSEITGISQPKVRKILKGEGIDIHKNRAYNIPTDLPSDEGELAYMVGLIATDGCLLSSRSSISFVASEEDYNTIKWLLSKISTNKELRYINCKGRPIKIGDTDKEYSSKQGQYGFCLVHKPLYEYLTSLGVSPNKSKTLSVNLEGKSDRYLLYFLRGVIDGDGCVYLKNTDYVSGCAIQICSASKKFLVSIQEIFGGSISLTTKEGKGRGSLWTLYFNGASAQTLSKILPKEPYMISRKTEKMISLESKIVRYIKTGAQLKGSLWSNTEKYPQPKNWKMLYKEIENPVVSFSQVKHRLFDYGWTLEQALYTPCSTLNNRGKYSTKFRKH